MVEGLGYSLTKEEWQLKIVRLTNWQLTPNMRCNCKNALIKFCVCVCQSRIERRNFNWIKSRNQHMDSCTLLDFYDLFLLLTLMYVIIIIKLNFTEKIYKKVWVITCIRNNWLLISLSLFGFCEWQIIWIVQRRSMFLKSVDQALKLD